MKISNSLFSTVLLFCFAFLSSNTIAQEDRKTRGLFVDFDISAMVADNDFMGHAAVASGYRFNEKLAAGVEWRSASKFSISNNFDMNGIGLTYRYTDKWFLGKLAIGKVLKASRGADFGDWQYKKGGFYYSASLAYRIRPGFLFGFSYTSVRENQFDKFSENIGTGELTFLREETINFGAIGIMLGVALPGRGRHKD